MKGDFNLKKVILLGILIFIIGVLLIGYSAFNGNPISKSRAKSNVEQYLKEKYRDKDFYIKEMGYNFKNKNYYANIESKKSNIYFTIESNSKEIKYDEFDSTDILSDSKLILKFSNEVSNRISNLYKEKISYINVLIDIPQNKYKKNAEFSNNIDDEFYVDLKLEGSFSKEELSNYAYDIKEEVKSLGLKGFNGIQVTDNSDNVITLYKEELNFTKEEIVKKDTNTLDIKEIYEKMYK